MPLPLKTRSLTHGLPWAALFLLTACANAENTVSQCQFDPQSGQVNPLGMRAFISIVKEEGQVIFTYEQFPAFVKAEVPMALGVQRTLIMEGVTIEEARSLMRENNQYYETLVGYSDEAGFSSYDEVLSCQ